MSESEPKFYRPLDPKAGMIILGGSLVVSGAVTVVLAWLLPWPQQWLDRINVPLTSSGLWLMVNSVAVFPVVFAYAFLRLAKGVAPMRQAMAYAGTVYFLQCAAELAVRNDMTLWWQLMATAIATVIFHSLASRRQAGRPDPESDPAG